MPDIVGGLNRSILGHILVVNGAIVDQDATALLDISLFSVIFKGL